MAKKIKLNEEAILFVVMLVFAAAVAYYLKERTDLFGHNYQLVEGVDHRRKKR